MPIAYSTRAYSFCAGHRLFDPARDPAWNELTFGKCSWPGGHGHNYRVELTVRGVVSEETGWIVPPAVLDGLFEDVVLARLDHRNLNDILSRDFGPAPTTEVLLLELWRAMEGLVAPPAALHRIVISETSKNTFEYHGPGAAPRRDQSPSKKARLSMPT